ncbi:hypothetical protein HOLleu_21254 [Holothuria leucospilota]|uniref:G-protein coupled receptors family 1 profile domain-containing protein n=1 Tax=Holothuria leucospilota TaxID=206669 RepID=A0A9Q1H3W4_HOLLE|nr:hypothetical protein HOLleu_21254 [Holothuria leucospilota]
METDLICWFPVIITGILSAVGTDISVDMYAWLTVLVMPVNSALNPFIYTIPTIKKKKSNEPSFIGEQRNLEKKKKGNRQKRWITTAFKVHSYKSSISITQVST